MQYWRFNVNFCCFFVLSRQVYYYEELVDVFRDERGRLAWMHPITRPLRLLGAGAKVEVCHSILELLDALFAMLLARNSSALAHAAGGAISITGSNTTRGFWMAIARIIFYKLLYSNEPIGFSPATWEAIYHATCRVEGVQSQLLPHEMLSACLKRLGFFEYMSLGTLLQALPPKVPKLGRTLSGRSQCALT